MAKGFIDLLLDDIFDAEWKGRYGEKMTEWELNLVRLFGRKGYVLRNIYVPKNNGETSEIDVVFITQKGIFVIESKDYSGWIFGGEKSAYWTAMLPDKSKNRFYNPIKQNSTHIKWLGQYLQNSVPLFSVIVFSERCELKKVAVESTDVLVIKRDRLYAAIRSIWDRTADILSESMTEDIYVKLKMLTDVDQAVRAAHVDRINEKYKKTETVNKPEGITEQNTSLKCPRCGGTLVLRTAREKGANAGIAFMAVRIIKMQICAEYLGYDYVQVCPIVWKGKRRLFLLMSKKERILKEFIDGDTVYEMVLHDNLSEHA